APSATQRGEVTQPGKHPGLGAAPSPGWSFQSVDCYRWPDWAVMRGLVANRRGRWHVLLVRSRTCLKRDQVRFVQARLDLVPGFRAKLRRPADLVGQLMRLVRRQNDRRQPVAVAV